MYSPTFIALELGVLAWVFGMAFSGAVARANGLVPWGDVVMHGLVGFGLGTPPGIAMARVKVEVSRDLRARPGLVFRRAPHSRATTIVSVVFMLTFLVAALASDGLAHAQGGILAQQPGLSAIPCYFGYWLGALVTLLADAWRRR